MTRRLLISACAALVCAAAWAAPARADMVAWSYQWSVTSPSLPVVTATTGTGGVIFAAASGNSANDSNVNAARLTTYGDGTFANAGYTLSLLLKDTLSGASTTLTFSGALSGPLSSSPPATMLTNSFTTPTTLTATLGGNLYTVTLSSYSPPPPPGQGDGVLGATVHVVAGGGIGVPASVPEPSSMVLAALGCSSLLALRFRRRRKAAEPA